jgi:Asp-tRNA(Asn)/Glu-tRNA(Gln) amidotransferase A subunit family amidase
VRVTIILDYSLASLAGIGRLPQLYLLLVESSGVPVGLSLLAVRGRDAFLASVAKRLATAESGAT